MKKEPKIIVCMINFNGSKMTLDCLNDLGKVNYGNKEIVILDNGSDKQSVNELEKSRKKYNFDLIKLKNNIGYAGGANRLIEYIVKKKKNYSYVLFLNNDMLFPDKDFLIKMVAKIENNSEIGIINPLILKKNGRLQNGGAYLEKYIKFSKRIYDDSPEEDWPKEDYLIDLYCGCSWLVRKKVLDKENIKFKESYFVYCEDEEFCIQVREKGYKIMVDVSSKVIHLGGESANKLGSGFAIYYITRNEIWMRKEHASKKNIFVYFMHHFFTIFPKRIIYLVFFRKDFSALKSYFQGLIDGIFRN